MIKITDVAVAIFLKPDGSFLLSSRPEGKPYPGYWEFPGGKVEVGEAVRDALVRELIEELNVTITHATPWFTFMMHYTHATVRLHCWRVHLWQGEMRGMEGQQFAWQTLDAMNVEPALPGCVPIFLALGLPQVYAITNAGELGVAAYLQRLESALKNGLRLIQLREKTKPYAELRSFGDAVMKLARAHGARVLVNGDGVLANEIGADGVHLSAAQLLTLTARPEFALVGASTHSRVELERAAELKCDFAVLGPVKATPTHPSQQPIGWSKFAALTRATPLPCYALGGMSIDDLANAVGHGAHGVAMQRGLNKASNLEVEWR